MKHNEIWNAVNAMYRVNKANNPGFPDHVCGKVSMVAQPVGKLTEIAVEMKYNSQHEDAVYNKMLEDNAIDTIVAAIRLLENLK